MIHHTQNDFDWVILTRVEFHMLPEYSCTIPTGTTIGKRWRRREPYGAPEERAAWFMGEYVPSPMPGHVGIHWRRIEVREEGFIDYQI